MPHRQFLLLVSHIDSYLMVQACSSNNASGVQHIVITGHDSDVFWMVLSELVDSVHKTVYKGVVLQMNGLRWIGCLKRPYYFT